MQYHQLQKPNLRRQRTRLKNISTVETRLFEVVSTGLTLMQTRRLEGTPSSDNMPDTAELMTADLFVLGYTDDDCDRISEAIASVGRSQSKFPTVCHVKQHIKSKEQIALDNQPQKSLISNDARDAEQERRKNSALKALSKIREILNVNLFVEENTEQDKAVRRKVTEDFIKKYGNEAESNRIDK